MKLILAQGGGGTMGIGPARYLAMLEAGLEILNVGRKFDIHIGTSIGAIDQGLLACGYGALEVLRLHREHSAGIFGSKNWAYRLLKNGPQYDDSYVVKLLKAKLGGITMSQTARPFYAVAWNARTKDIKVFGPGDTDVPVWFAIRASMAASTFFAPVDSTFVDGGFAANMPTVHGIAAAINEHGISASDTAVLSLVTSGKNPSIGPIETGWNILTTLSRVVIPAVTSGNSSDAQYIANAWVGKENSFFVRPLCQNASLDDVKHLDTIETIWAQQYINDSAELKLFMRKGE